MLRFQESQQSITEQIWVLAIVETETHLVQIGLQMLCTHAMPRSNDAPLKQRKGGFDSVCINVSVNVDAVLVADCLVLAQDASVLESLWVGPEFIGHNHIYVLRDVFSDVFRQCARLHVRRVEETKLAAALPDADDDLFLAPWMTGLVLMTALTSADECLVYFDCSTELWAVIVSLHGFPDAMAQVPCGAVIDTEHPFKLIRGHSFARLANQECGEKPLHERQMSVMELRIRRNRELISALFVIAVVLIAFQDRRDFPSPALGALNAMRPAQTFKVVAAGLLIAVAFHQLAQIDRLFHGGVTLPRRKLKKHPMDMTDEEALRHIFHPKIVRAVKKHLENQEQESKSGKRRSQKQQ